MGDCVESLAEVKVDNIHGSCKPKKPELASPEGLAGKRSHLRGAQRTLPWAGEVGATPGRKAVTVLATHNHFSF